MVRQLLNPVSTPWVVTPRPDRTATIRLFCFPYAGAGASVFRNWATLIPPSVELHSIQYPGREERFSEPLHRDLETLLPELSDALGKCLDKPFVFFGHSMGGDIAHRLLLERQKQGLAQARYLIVSGTRAPQLKRDRPLNSELDDERFCQRLQTRGGMPDEVLQNVELMSVLMPRLRADITLAETMPQNTDRLINCPMAAFGGDLDPEVSSGDIEAWRTHTDSTFSTRLFSGNHFFIHQSQAEVIDAVNRFLGKVLDQNRSVTVAEKVGN